MPANVGYYRNEDVAVGPDGRRRSGGGTPAGVTPTSPVYDYVNQFSDSNLVDAAKRAPFVANDDIQGLEAFSLNEQKDASFGDSSVRTLFGIAGREGAEAAAQKARDQARKQAIVSGDTFRRQTAGLDLSGRQQRLAERRISLNRALAEADAGSASRRGSTDRATFARRAGADLEGLLFGQEAAGMIDLANAEGQKKLADEQRRSAKKQKKNNIIGTIIGIGASIFSSEEWKDKRGKPEDLLTKLRKTRVEKWNYKGEDVEHIGPYAEEFNELFGVGQTNNKMISVVDALGVTMGAIKELDQKVESLRG